MHRYYAKHKPSIDFSDFMEAIKQIKIHKNLIRFVAEMRHYWSLIHMPKLRIRIISISFFFNFLN